MQPCGAADASTRTRLTLLLRQFSPEWPRSNTCAGIRSTYSCWIGGTESRDRRAKPMTAIYQEIASPAPPAASTPAIDFAIVLARTIADLEKDPAQLRNVVYQLARVKLQQEAAQRDLPVSPLEMEHLTSALETAIDRVETMSLKHDNPGVLQSGADNSDVNGRDIVIAQPRKTNALPTFLRRDPFVGISRRDARPSRWPQRGPLLRTAIVITLALTACVLLDRHFGVFNNSRQLRSRSRCKTRRQPLSKRPEGLSHHQRRCHHNPRDFRFPTPMAFMP